MIFVSIDDTEFHNVRILMDEVFGPRNWICTLIWKRRQTSDSRNLNGVSADHEYVLCYGRGPNVRFKGQKKDLGKYTNPDNDPLGPWMSDNLTGLANATERPNLHYDVVNPATGRRYAPHPSRGWIYGRDRMSQLIEAGRILWPKSATGRPRLKRFVTDMKSETTGLSTLLDAPANVAGTKILGELLGPKVFAFPKPPGLIKTLIEQVVDADDIVLDSFAGSATTGQAVIELNRADDGKRRFLLVEMEDVVARDVAAPRLSKVINGSGESTPNAEGFRYCSLAPPLFDQRGNIRDGVTFPDLAAHVYFTETGEPIPKRANKSPLLGIHNGRALYLLFNGVLGDKRPDGGNVLTGAVLSALPEHDGPRVVYGEGCRLGAARLKREAVVFKQLPYGIKTT